MQTSYYITYGSIGVSGCPIFSDINSKHIEAPEIIDYQLIH